MADEHELRNQEEEALLKQALQDSAEFNDKTVSEFLQEYRDLKEKVYKMDASNPSEGDRETLKQYAEYKDFLDEVRRSLDFVKASTYMLKGRDEQSIECRSLLSDKEQYVSLMNRLTNGMDKKFTNAVEESRTEPIDAGEFSRLEYLAGIQAPLRMPEISTEMERQIQAQEQERRISDIQNAIQEVDKEMDKQHINRDDIIASTVAMFIISDADAQTNVLSYEEDHIAPLPKPRYFVVSFNEETETEHKLETSDWESVKRFAVNEMLEGNADVTILDGSTNEEVTLNAKDFKEHYDAVEIENGYFPVQPEKLDEIDYESYHKPPQPVEIVESSDGYVMASSEITPENEAEFNSRVNQANNEVIHNEAPQETTIDRSAVGGKVKLESVEDLGSRELSQIENGGGAYGSLADRYENTKYDETPEEPESSEEEQEAEEFGGFDDIL